MAGSVNIRRTRDETADEASRPKLKVIDRESLRRRAIRRSVLGSVCLFLVLGLFAVALAQAKLVQGQQRLDDMRAELRQAEDARAQLEREVDRSSAPEVIVDRATSMGMVRASDPIYLTAIKPLPAPVSSNAAPASLASAGP